VLGVARDGLGGGSNAVVGGPQLGDDLSSEYLRRRDPLVLDRLVVRLHLAGRAVEQVGVDAPGERLVLYGERLAAPGEVERGGVDAGLLADLIAGRRVRVSLGMAGHPTPLPGIRTHVLAPAEQQDLAPVAEEHGDDVGRFVVGHTRLDGVGTD
jgi:hypothetical protein